jgi:hypothetical protein
VSRHACSSLPPLVPSHPGTRGVLVTRDSPFDYYYFRVNVDVEFEPDRESKTVWVGHREVPRPVTFPRTHMWLAVLLLIVCPTSLGVLCVQSSAATLATCVRAQHLCRPLRVLRSMPSVESDTQRAVYCDFQGRVLKWLAQQNVEMICALRRAAYLWTRQYELLPSSASAWPSRTPEHPSLLRLAVVRIPAS